MSQSGFTKHDFDLMKLPGLENRMHAIREHVQPKFSRIADQLVPFLNKSADAEMPFYPHIARHARRTVNPPDSTWLAIAQDKRGYKKHPHFQFGIWPTHLFFWLAVIEEYPDKAELGEALLARIRELVKQTPADYAWSADHMKDEYRFHHDLNEEELSQLFLRLKTFKKAELLCGVVIPKNEAIAKSADELTAYLKEQVAILLPLYMLARACSGVSV
ncbi:DUF1054 domain-containing protein [Sporolactobacillus shoreicorticis]|uniref:UPF0637 protein ACFSUE_14245 n=1 Tax=Sporolactobacillus shoreicorticis TaxID=1923877 RepID=A0ABW5S641_9BACL|nr:DUF1054 domain-containing protein [Sporolactobacillus shoreicorticis]MCO7126264.1 DUF1054 domain-containing protein [Sporolactobacillus shoreicorticis]